MEISTSALAAELKARGYNVKPNGAGLATTHPTTTPPAAAPTIVIEKGIALVPSRFGRPRTATIYPLGDMLVGDSFFVPVAAGQSAERLQNSVSACGRSPIYAGRKFATRQLPDKSGVRVWRTA